MLFSSITFLYFFLPCVVIIYYLVPRLAKNYVLLIASLVFYAWGELKYIIILLLEIIAGYITGKLIEKYRTKKHFDHYGNDNNLNKSKVTIVLCTFILLEVGILIWFKYSGATSLPVGISFYTFQLISYGIDVYRGDTSAQNNPFTLATYVSMFPQLVAGPIVRYQDIAIQLNKREHSFDKAAAGVRRFAFGLAKKILIANELGELCNIFRNSVDLSVGYYWLYAIAFTLQIYYDFSGYSDMAIGLGKVFGFDFMENFNYPYVSGSITEFWRRWHISLGSWFRDYVYIPLGGSRVSGYRWIRNILIVWTLTGVWHGAALNFAVWGMLFALLLIFEKKVKENFILKNRFLKHIYVMFFVVISFVIFNANGIEQAVSDIANMFGLGGLPIVSIEFFYYLKSYSLIILLAVVGSLPLKKFLNKNSGVFYLRVFLEPALVLVLLILTTAFLINGSFNPFLYFRF